MSEQTLPRRAWIRKLQMIPEDPDLWPEEAEFALMYNRGLLEDEQRSYTEKRNQVVARVGTANGEEQPSVSSQNSAFQTEHEDILDEEVTLQVRTVNLETARALAENIEDDYGASPQDWYWMLSES